MLADLRQDVRLALRLLRTNPMFTLVAVLSLALGIGANTAVFTMVNAAMLQALPVRAPEELRLVERTFSRRSIPSVVNSGYGNSFAYPTFEAFRARTEAFASVVGFASLSANNVNTVIDGRPALVDVQIVTGSFFAGLGISPVLGRVVQEDDVRPGAAVVAVLSYGWWAQQFGRDPSVVGRVITVNRVPCTIVGVAPPEFFGLEQGRAPHFWLPISDRPELAPWGAQAVATERPALTSRTWWWMQLMVRVKPGVSDDQARAVLAAALQDSLIGHITPSPTPGDMPQLRVTPGSHGLEMLRRRFSLTFSILMGLVGLVLLAACANLGTLLLARATARQKEIAVRLALGASRGRLIRQLLTESLVLAAIGGASGLLVAWVGSRALLSLISTSRTPIALDLRPDPTVLTFAAGVSILTGLVFGLAPALRATRVRLGPGLGERGAAAASGMARGRLGVSKSLIVVQVAISLLLLIGAGLFVRSLQKLEGQQVGFDRQHLLVFGLDTVQVGYDDLRSTAFYNGLVTRLGGLAGVRSATLIQNVLLGGTVNNMPIEIDGVSATPDRPLQIHFNVVGSAFCDTMGMRRLLGRDIEPRDTEVPPRVAVINDMMARQFFGDGNPIGRRFRFTGMRGLEQTLEIVGVVETAKYASLRDRPVPTAYVPYAYLPSAGRMSVALRTAGDPAALIPVVRGVMRDLAPDLPLLNLRTQTEQIAESLARERLFARLASFFGVVALLLACIGLHGTMAYAVGRRTQEIGIRMALGAQRRQVLGLVLHDAILLVVAGVLLGVPSAIVASRLVTSQLYEVTGSDPVTLWSASALMIGTALLAAFLPARRATRIDPMAALRNA